jgi:pimeloyl-ACP methyl ester carboxylesterase
LAEGAEAVSAFDAWQAHLHGHEVIYRTAGSGPPVVLIHGMVNSSRHWRDVAREVSAMLRGAALPGASVALKPVAGRGSLAALERLGAVLEARRSGLAVYVRAIVRALRPLERAGSHEAFLQTLRSVIDLRGQRVGAVDRLYLLGPVPTLIVWGERDHTIPLAHGPAAHEAIPHSRLETLPRAAHFPHLEDPDGLADVLLDFMATTEPCRLDDADWSELVSSRNVRRRQLRSVA